MLRQRMQTAMRVLYPPDCLSCGGITESENSLCGPCWRDCHFLTSAVCDKCGIPVLSRESEGNILCDTCLTTARGWNKGRAALLYEGTGRRLVLGLKHADRHELATPAAQWMAAVTPTQDQDAIVVPVPLHWTRLAKRRYNQSALLAQKLAKTLGLRSVPDALRRKNATPTLDGKTREARSKLMSSAIDPHPKRGADLEGRPVLLVDDVMTSGATLGACAEACIHAGARNVDVVVLARVARDA